MSNRQDRASVYAAIDGERQYQIDQQGNAKRHDGQPPMTPGEHLIAMEHVLTIARTAWYAPNGGTACLEHIRKATALGVACMELYGAPERAGYPSKPAEPA